MTRTNSTRAGAPHNADRMRLKTSALLLATCASAASLLAQRSPPVRPLGPIIKVSPPGILGSVSYVRVLPGGNLIVSDVLQAQVILFNANLEKVKAIYDSTTADWAGRLYPMGAILAFKADSTLFIDIRSLSMLVLDANGDVARVMAVPSSDMPGLRGGPYGSPAHDARGRLVFRKGLAASFEEETATIRKTGFVDSIPLYRVDLASREQETLTYVKVPPSLAVAAKDNADRLGVITMFINPYAIVDDWVLAPDGRVAVIRGKDYHVDWLALDGHWTSTAKIPFAWERLDDEAKVRLVDSVNTAQDSLRHAMEERVRTQSVNGRPSIRPGEPRGAFRMRMVPPMDLADYRPAFKQGATRVDADGNLWVRTTTPSDKGPIYDVISGKGELIDRVRLPFGRVISGFGPGEVYLGVLDDKGARLERARIH
jgi:hypothetical protein